jgi:hypothetical protein
MALDIVDLMWTDLRLCHPFLSRETKKLSDIMMLTLSSSSVIEAEPTAQARQVTFLSWNLTEARTSSTLLTRGSLWVTGWGNLLILLRMGPTTTGTFLRTVSEARRSEYFLAQPLTSFLSLLNFLRESRSITSMSMLNLATSSLCFSSAMMQSLRVGRGLLGRRTVPTKRLSFWGS